MAIDPQQQAKINAEGKLAQDRMALAQKMEADAQAQKLWNDQNSPAAQEQARIAQQQADAADKRIITGIETAGLGLLGIGLAEKGLNAIGQSGTGNQSPDGSGAVSGTSYLAGGALAQATGQIMDTGNGLTAPGDLTGNALNALLGGGKIQPMDMLFTEGGGAPGLSGSVIDPRSAQIGFDTSGLQAPGQAFKPGAPGMDMGPS